MPTNTYEPRGAHAWVRNNILGMVAIFIALSGTAIATGVVTKEGAQSAAKRGKRGPAGTPGLQGPAGPQGAAGQNGSPDTGSQILTKLAPADGAGSGLDADSLDNLDSTAFASNGTEAWHELGAGVSGVCDPNGNFCRPGPAGNYQNLGGGFSTGAFLRDPAGIVHLKGVVQRTGDGGAIPFRLPDGYRPALGEIFATTSAEAFATIYINEGGTGNVVVQAGNPDVWISLDGISFRCEPSGSNGCP